MRMAEEWKDVWIDYQILIESMQQDGTTHHRLNALKKLNRSIEERMKKIKEENKYEEFELERC